MPPIVELIGDSLDLTALVVLVIFTPFFAFFTARVARGHGVPLRTIAVYQHIRELVSQAAETGMSIHVSLGRAHVGTDATPDSVAGLYALSYVAQRADLYGQTVASTSGDAATYAMAQNMPATAQSKAMPSDRAATFAGDDPLAFASGAALQAGQEPLLAQVAVGSYGGEALLLTQNNRQPQAMGLGATSDLATASLLYASMDDVAVGEDAYAAGAYLGRRLHLGSLVAQDLVRIVIILSILVGVALTSLGYWG